MSVRVARNRLHVAAFAAVVIAAAGGCAADPAAETLLERRIRLDVPAGGVKVVVLGSGDPQEGIAPPVGPGPVAANAPGARLPASLAVVAPETGALLLVEATAATERQLAALATNPELPPRPGRPPSDGVLVTRVDEGTIVGLAFLAEAFGAEPVPLYGRRATLGELWPRLPGDAAGGFDLRPLADGEPATPCPGMRVTPLLAAGTADAAFRIAGARRSLLYAPRGDAFGLLGPSLAGWLADADVAILDGGSVRFDGASLHDWTADQFLARTKALETAAGHPLVVLFTNLSRDNPFHDPAGRLRERLRANSADLLEDGTEFWL